MQFGERFRSASISVLRWSERYTKTDMVYLASGGFWSVVGQLSASVIALGLAVIMARYVPKDVYGSYKYILAVVSILATFSLSGLGTAVLQSVARGYRGALSEAFWANLRWSGLVFIGTLLAGGYYLLHGNSTFGIGILIGGCTTPFLASYNLYVAYLSGEKDFRAIAWYGDFLTNIIPALLLISTAFISPQPLSLLIMYFVGNTGAAAYAYFRALQKHPSNYRFDPEMLSYSKHLSVMNILSGIAGNVDQVLLFHFVGPVELAVYNFATGIVDQSKGPMKMLDTMMQAQFAYRTNSEIKQGLWNKVFWLFIGTTCCAVVYILAAPFIFSILFPTYMEAVPYSQVYALSLFALVTYPIASYFTAKKQIRVQYIGTSLSSVIQIGLMVIGTIGWGLWGLVIARVITRVSSNIITLGLYLLGPGA